MTPDQKEAYEALLYLADNERPQGGEDRFNAAHLYQIANALAASQPAPAAADAIEALEARVAELEAGLRFLTAPDASYHGAIIRLEIPCESHGDAIRKLDDVRSLLERNPS